MKGGRKISLWWLVLAPIVFGLFAMGAPVGLVFVLARIPERTVKFLAPGQHTVTVEKPGVHILWYDASTIYEGRVYNKPRRLPDGVQISLIRAESGESVPMTTSFSMSRGMSGDKESYSVGKFDISTPGQYIVEIEGEMEPRVFSFAPSDWKYVLVTFAGVMVVSLVGWVGAAAIVVIVLIKRYGRQSSE